MSDIAKFVEYMFIDNNKDRLVELCLEGIENNKDLFLFFIDLFSRGLVMCYGNPLNFDDLDEIKFGYIQKKLANAGIDIHLVITKNPVPLATSINSAEIDEEDNHKPLESYVFRIIKSNYTYHITFSLRRLGMIS